MQVEHTSALLNTTGPGMTLSNSELIGIGGIAATIIAAAVAWFASARSTKKSLATQSIGYRMSVAPLLAVDGFPGGAGSLKIEFNGDILVEPALLSVDITNLGNRAIENPPIVVESEGATYVIPIYIEDVPVGYEDLWTLRRTDAEQCSIVLSHINPGQVVKARFLLDEIPPQSPVFKCPMKDVVVKEIRSVEVVPLASALLETIAPAAYSALKIFKG